MLNGHQVYVTLEPGLMCFALTSLSGIEKITFGARSTLFGPSINNFTSNLFYSKNISIEGGVQEKESLALLSRFFKALRKKRKDTK